MSSSTSSSSSSLPSSPSSLSSHCVVVPSLSLQYDWEVSLRNALQTKPTTTSGANSNSQDNNHYNTQFWLNASKYSTDAEADDIVDILSPGSSAPSTSTSPPSSLPSSITDKVRAFKPTLRNSADFNVAFLTPLQCLVRYSPFSLDQLVVAPRSTYSHIHTGDKSREVYSVDVNHDCTSAISAAGGGELKVWDPSSGNVRADLSSHKGDVRLSRFFPSGSVCLSAGLDLSIKIWSIDHAVVAAQLNGHTRPVTQVIFIGRGKSLISGSEDGTARLWDVSQQAAISNFPNHPLSLAPKVNDILLIDPTSHPFQLNNNSESSEVRIALVVFSSEFCSLSHRVVGSCFFLACVCLCSSVVQWPHSAW